MKGSGVLSLEPARSLALEHVRRRLASAPSTLSHAAGEVDLERGWVEILDGDRLASDTSGYTTAESFESGGGSSSRPANLQARDAIKRYIHETDRGVLLMQSWDQANDAAVRLSVVRVTIVDGDVWTVVDDALTDDRYVERALALWLDPYTGAALLGRASQSVWDPGSLASIVSEVLGNIDAILVGAFDGEGFLLWHCG